MIAKIKKMTCGFRFNSVLVRTLSLILLLVVTLTSIFMYSSLKIAIENYRKDIYTSRINMLVNTSNAVEITFENLAQLMRQTINNSYCISAMIVPNRNNYERTNNIINYFHNITSGYSLVKKVLLYIPTDNTVYSSDKSLLPVIKSPDAPLIDAIYNQNLYETVLSNSSSYTTKIRLLDDRIILYQNLLPDYHKQIGTLIFEIDTDYLHRAFLSSFSDINETTYVLNSSGQMIFKNSDMSKFDPHLIDIIKKENKNAGQIKPIKNIKENIIYFYYISPVTNWVYLSTIISSEMQPHIFYINEAFTLFLILIIGFIISICIAYRIYSPIRVLVDKIINREGGNYIEFNENKVKDEIGLLDLAYTKTNQRNEQLRNILEHIEPMAMERLFTNIMFDRETSENRIKETLKSIGDPIPYVAHYTVLIASIENEINDSVSEYDMNLILMEMRSILSSVLKCSIYRSVLRLTDQTIAAVLVFPLEMTTSEVRDEIAIVYYEILNKLNRPPFKVYIGLSNLYKYITDLRYCYLEAKENLNHKYFYGESRNMENSNLSIMNDSADYIKRIMIHIVQGDMKNAMMLFRQICTNISKLENTEEAILSYNALKDIIVEKLIALKLAGTEDVFREKSQLEKNIKDCEDINEIEQHLNMFFANIIQNIERRNKAKKYQNIMRIREYIHENSSDRDLSLEVVADHVGINPTYLSRLFKEEIGMPFVDYLNQMRIEKAKELLINTDILIKDIGYQCGFNSMQNFFRVFKKYTSTTPGNFRQINKR